MADCTSTRHYRTVPVRLGASAVVVFLSSGPAGCARNAGANLLERDWGSSGRMELIYRYRLGSDLYTQTALALPEIVVSYSGRTLAAMPPCILGIN